MRLHFAIMLLGAGLMLQPPEVLAQTTQQVSGPPYENQLIKLAQTLGSLHYLSNLCDSTTTLWRDQMDALLTSENTDAKRRKILISGFNNSYRAYADNYSQCSDQAIKAIARFKSEGEALTRQLISHYGN